MNVVKFKEIVFRVLLVFLEEKKNSPFFQSKKISNDQELIQSDPISCPQNQKGNN